MVPHSGVMEIQKVDGLRLLFIIWVLIIFQCWSCCAFQCVILICSEKTARDREMSKQPNREEVEDQFFVFFSSREGSIDSCQSRVFPHC
jgi:hypothetical protein